MSQSQYFLDNIELHKSIVEVQHQKISLWLENVVFTPQWWTGVCLSIFPWILWILLNKKESRDRLLYSGFIIIIISSFLDFLGVHLGLWLYNYEVFPWMPAYIPWDWTLLPVVIMGLIEYKPQLSPVLKAVLFALLTSFVGEYLFEALNFYKKLNWNSYYSVPVYFLLFYIGYWASLRKNFKPYY